MRWMSNTHSHGGVGFSKPLECSSSPSQPYAELGNIHGLLGQLCGQQMLIGIHWPVFWIPFFLHLSLISPTRAFDFRRNLPRSKHFPEVIWELVMTVTLKQLLLNCGTSEMWWIWQDHFKRGGKVSQCAAFLQASTYIQMDVWSADAQMSLCWMLLLQTAKRRAGKELLQQINAAPSIWRASAKKQNKLHKVDHSQFVSVCSGNAWCWSLFPFPSPPNPQWF